VPGRIAAWSVAVVAVSAEASGVALVTAGAVDGATAGVVIAGVAGGVGEAARKKSGCR
jgi:hypothetical protein